MFSRVVCTLIVCISPLSVTADSEVDTVIAAALKKLPGHTGCAFTEISGKESTLLYGVRPDDKFAVGSTFKLFILGALAAEVNDGRRELENTMRLSPELIGPPTSELASWPIGSPVTLNTLALKMITISDNTATDHLQPADAAKD